MTCQDWQGQQLQPGLNASGDDTSMTDIGARRCVTSPPEVTPRPFTRRQVWAAAHSRLNVGLHRSLSMDQADEYFLLGDSVPAMLVSPCVDLVGEQTQ